jgi:ribosomal protein S18 acetylase RimI-like enzyme
MPRPREATVDEAMGLWPAARADRLFDDPLEFAAYRDAGPWRVRVADRGEAALLGVWRHHLDVLAMRGVWCSPRHVASFADDARTVAKEHGLGRVLSPLLPLDLLGAYQRAGMEACEEIVAIQGHPARVRSAEPPPDVTLRAGLTSDLPDLAQLDAQSFDEFWKYGLPELAEYSKTERLIVAGKPFGEVIGYTLATVSRGAATLGRLVVAPSARRQGLARALVADVAEWAAEAGASNLSLCTQASNFPARHLYAEMGLIEVAQPYGFAMGVVDEGRGGG